ncbi:MAG: HDOD domain-containing protein [Methylicorpusculum sp.]|nr:HDOD domain-containing protein [Methylicorpusculum sp.]
MKWPDMMDATLINWTLSNIAAPLEHFSHPSDMRSAVSKIKELPPLPGIAEKVIKLAADPLADAAKLASIIELDPILTTQVIRWASSPLYGFRGKITTVKDAISRVLGFDFVMNLALGLSALQPLRAPKHGVIGTEMLWVQSLAGTRLIKQLNRQLMLEKQTRPDVLFLSALMHNIGFPLLGHEFPEEFLYLNKIISVNPTLNTFNIEQFTFGVDHTQLGAWLMTSWAMPKPILDIVYHHHNPYYRGEHYLLNLLVYLTDSLLGKLGIGDAQNQHCEDDVFVELGLDLKICESALNDINDVLPDIKATAASLLGS